MAVGGRMGYSRFLVKEVKWLVGGGWEKQGWVAFILRREGTFWNFRMRWWMRMWVGFKE
jgi:hypothetical protein